MLCYFLQPTHEFVSVEEGVGLAAVDGDSDEEGKTDAEVDVKDVRTDSVRHSHVAVSVSRHQHRTESILQQHTRHSENTLNLFLNYILYMLAMQLYSCRALLLLPLMLLK